MASTDDIKKALTAPTPKPREWPGGLSTGSTLLNLACSGDPNIGFLRGHYFYIVGDSSSGKTFLSLTCLAEASRDKRFKNHRFIFDNAENGALMEIRRFFGAAVAGRIEPAGKQGASVTVDDFYFHLDDMMQENEPAIYVLDSMDSLVPSEDVKKLRARKNAARKSGNKEDLAGSYGLQKAKANSQGLRMVRPWLERTGSILIIISQTRDNINPMSFNTKTRAGGRSLTFYAGLEMWSSIKKHITKDYKGKKVEQGVISQVRIKKNRLQGQNHTVELPILHSHGFDDVGGCINYLLEWKHWQVTKGKKDGGDTAKTATVYENPVIAAPEFDFEGRAEKLVQLIECDGREDDLRRVVAGVWDGVRAASTITRKPRYT